VPAIARVATLVFHPPSLRFSVGATLS